MVVTRLPLILAVLAAFVGGPCAALALAQRTPPGGTPGGGTPTAPKPPAGTTTTTQATTTTSTETTDTKTTPVRTGEPKIVAALPTKNLAPSNLAVPQSVKLSDELTLSRWAYSERRAKIYSRASLFAKRKGRLRLYTEDRFPEVYLLLEEYVDSKHRIWVKIRIPGRPNGRTGWVTRGSLGAYRQNAHHLTIDRKNFKATLRRRGQVIWQASVGVGKKGTITPSGRFYVREKFRFKNRPVYGSRAIGTSAYAPTLSDWPGGGVVGIHGTDQPEILPGRVSHGCVRIRNHQIIQLYKRIPIGTPILIQ